MHTLRISCFGILLKHHLQRHYADAVTSKGRLRPALETALAGIPADFQVSSEIVPAVQRGYGAEEHVTIQIDLQNDEVSAFTFRLSVQGILVRHGLHDEIHVMPFALRFLSDTGITLQRLHEALMKLTEQPLRAILGRHVRIGSPRFQVPAFPARTRWNGFPDPRGLNGKEGQRASTGCAASDSKRSA